jgi:predicted TIM-barrel fold metal-dependent hydrolase
MDFDGVIRSVLYPTVAGIAGQRFVGIEDVELERACCAAYNDYLIDEWAGVSERYVAQCVVPLGDVSAAVAEIRRSAERGHRGIVMVGNPSLIRADLPHVNEQHWDPIWAVSEELDLPVCFHSGSSPKIQMPPYIEFRAPIAAALEAMTRPVSSTFLLANLLFSGILVRFPRMKVVFAETTLAWAAYTLESAEHQFGRQRYDMAGWDVRPLEEFRRQIYLTGWYDKTGLDTRYHIGVKNMLWSTNFPQATSCWPESRHAAERCFAGVPPDETADILVNNANDLYGLE